MTDSIGEITIVMTGTPSQGMVATRHALLKLDMSANLDPFSILMSALKNVEEAHTSITL